MNTGDLRSLRDAHRAVRRHIFEAAACINPRGPDDETAAALFQALAELENAEAISGTAPNVTVLAEVSVDEDEAS